MDKIKNINWHGINPELGSFLKETVDRATKLQTQRDALLAALESMVKVWEGGLPYPGHYLEQARTAIAQAKGE